MPLLLPPILANGFQELDIAISAWSAGVWRAIYVMRHFTTLEAEQGVQPMRYRYNLRCLEQAQATRRTVHGKHAGFHDLWVPVQRRGVVEAILVCGPFALTRPTSAEVRDRWLAMTGRHAKMTDPGFARYLEATLHMLTLEGSLFPAFQRWLSCFARLVSGDGRQASLVAEAEGLRLKLLEARLADRMWDDARSMVDERSAHTWSTGLQRDPLLGWGMRRPPKHVLVGLLVGQSESLDPIAAALDRVTFQRACVALARQRGHFVSGRVGDRGVTILPDLDDSVRARAGLMELAGKLAALARRFGFGVRVGIALPEKSQSLALRYRAALAAAEKALVRGVSVELAEALPEASAQTLRHLRATLGAGIEEHPSHLAPRFERYLEAVLSHAGHGVEATRGHLQAGLERLAEPLLMKGVLDAKGFDQICSLADHPRDPDSLSELLFAYRRIVADVGRAVESPTSVRQEQGTRRALAFLHEHLAEPLSLARVAKVAGFAPDYFSKLLKEEEGLTFEQYLQNHRLARAKRLLSGTTLTVGRVAQLSGFRSRTNFQRLFKEQTGKTPVEFRKVPALSA